MRPRCPGISARFSSPASHGPASRPRFRASFRRPRPRRSRPWRSPRTSRRPGSPPSEPPVSRRPSEPRCCRRPARTWAPTRSSGSGPHRPDIGFLPTRTSGKGPRGDVEAVAGLQGDISLGEHRRIVAPQPLHAEFTMPSFDTVCEPNLPEVRNAVDNTAKEIATRFDFKGTPAAIELKEEEITLIGNADFQLDPDRGHPAQQAHQAQRRRALPGHGRRAEDRRRQGQAGDQGEERHRHRGRQEDHSASSRTAS